MALGPGVSGLWLMLMFCIEMSLRLYPAVDSGIQIWNAVEVNKTAGEGGMEYPAPVFESYEKLQAVFRREDALHAVLYQPPKTSFVFQVPTSAGNLVLEKLDDDEQLALANIKDEASRRDSIIQTIISQNSRNLGELEPLLENATYEAFNRRVSVTTILTERFQKNIYKINGTAENPYPPTYFFLKDKFPILMESLKISTNTTDTSGSSGDIFEKNFNKNLPIISGLLNELSKAKKESSNSDYESEYDEYVNIASVQYSGINFEKVYKKSLATNLTVSRIVQLSLEKVNQAGPNKRNIVELDFTTGVSIPEDNPVEDTTKRVIEQEVVRGEGSERKKRSNIEAELILQEEDKLYERKWEFTFKITVEGVITLALVQLPGVVLGFLGIIKAFSMYGMSKEACLKALR